jgi:predicted N-acetyltransferase YhbS
MGLVIRNMTRVELEVALDWAALEGWNPGIYDAESFFATDPSGFFLAELDNEPIGCISAVAYDAHFGFMGLYIVCPEYRGRRVGIELAKVGHAYLGSRTIGLDGVLPKQATYHTFGFQLAYRTIRHEGVGMNIHSPIQENGLQCVELATLPLKWVTDYDARFFPAPRPQFLQPWIQQPGARCLGLIQKERLVAYGVLRPCRSGCKIGPLAADDPYLAEWLFQELSSTHPGALIYLDVPEPNTEALLMARRHGMRPCFETVRMYSGSMPSIDMERQYGITTLELG